MKTLPLRHRLGIGIVALLGLVSISRAQLATPATRPAASSDSKFLRFVPDDRGGGVLQASVVTYRNAAGQSVDLIGAVHIAEPSFYHRLNKSFEGYDALLYEMVAPKDYVPGQPRPARPDGAASLSWVGMLQRTMTTVLELTFQLDGVDYTAKNFVHADLDVDTFFRMQDERGESMFSLMLQTMMRQMTDPQAQAAAAAQPGILDLIDALQSPDRARQLKLILARQFSQIDEMVNGMEGPNGSVLVTERNKAALKVLKQQLDKGSKKIGIFYGAAHLKGMEKIMTQDMGFKQVGEPQWFTAWDMTAPPPPATNPAQR